MGRTMKSIALTMALITMVITSAGAAGYLSGEFQKAMVGTQEASLKVDVLKQQQAKYEERKHQIDDQIANLPAKTTVNQRLRLMNGFKEEQAQLQAKINEIDKELPELQMKQIGTQAKAGPILVIAKSFDIPVEQAVKYVIFLMIIVFDPLAVFLIVAGNFLISQRELKKLKIDVPAQMLTETVLAPETVNKPQELPSALAQESIRNDEQIKPLIEEHEQEPLIQELYPTPLEIPAADVETQSIHEKLVSKDREEITKSMLGIVTPDPKTIVNYQEHGPGRIT